MRAAWLIVLVCALCLSAGAQAREPLFACLASEQIGVLVGETFSPFRDHRPGDHTLSLRHALVTNLQGLGARTAAISRRSLQLGSFEALAAPLDELDHKGGTLLLAFNLDAKEVPLVNEFLRGDQYPLRTVKLLLTGWIIDVPSREVLAEFTMPRNYAAYSTDEAVSNLSAEDFAETLTEAIVTSCEAIKAGNLRQPTKSQAKRPPPRKSQSSGYFGEMNALELLLK